MAENEKQSWLNRLKSGLAKSRNNLSYQVRSVFKSENVTEETWDDLEAILIGADVGVDSTMAIVDILKRRYKEDQIFDAETLTKLLETELVNRLNETKSNLDLDKLTTPAIILMVGVNGTGKTTTTGKLATRFKLQGHSVILAAADTFRAAAIEQLELWAKRANVELISQQRGSDPAAVVFDAVQSMRAKKIDIMLVDTAGRLHTYVNLMEELKKVKRVAEREAGDIPVYTILVIDATTGQNGITQAKIFNEAVSLDGLILTKLDGTAKGGIVVAVQRELGLPIQYIGIGEKLDDLRPFAADDFITALLD